METAAHEVLRRAAEHRRKTLERLCEDILLGTALGGSIRGQEAKATAYRCAGEKQKQEQAASASAMKGQATRRKNRDIAESADATPAQV
jgi:hypothetical protein